MSKRIIVSIACLGIIWVVDANAERLFAEDEPLENAQSGQVAETLNTEEEVEVDLFERGRGGEMGMGRGGRFGGGSGLGTFTVVTSDKRSILVNTTTGESWHLMIDNPGSHWEPIAMGVSKGGKTEISWSAAPAGAADVQPATQLSVDAEPGRLERVTNYAVKLQEALDSETEKNQQLQKTLASVREKNSALKKTIADYSEERTELKQQLEEAKKLLTARPQPAPPQPATTSEETNPFGGF
jgi:hypothetical protein